MKIGKAHSISKADIEKKKFNILVPICVGNRFFLDGTTPTENINKYINWSLGHTKEKVLIIIVDEIQISNWVVRNSNSSRGANMRRLMRRGEIIEKNILNIIKKLPKSSQEKIKVVRWREYYENDTFCKKVTEMIYSEFKTNNEFKEKVLEIIKRSITDRAFDERSYITLCKYVLDEFSLVYHGVNLEGIWYGLFIYPETDEVSDLIEDIKTKKNFPELSNKLDKQKIAVVFLR